MMQGDAYSIPIQIKTSAGIIDNTMIEDVEILIGIIRKTFKTGEVSYSEELQAFMFPITQADSFKLKGRRQPAQVRIKTLNGEVIGATMGDFNIDFSNSNEVL